MVLKVNFGLLLLRSAVQYHTGTDGYLDYAEMAAVYQRKPANLFLWAPPPAHFRLAKLRDIADLCTPG